MHAHTGVKTQRIGPGRGRMVARSDRFTPSHVDAACERMRGSAASASVERDGREGREAQSLVGKEVACSVPIPQ